MKTCLAERSRLHPIAIVLFATGAALGCSNGSEPGERNSNLPPSLFVVSSPVPRAPAARAATGTALHVTSPVSAVAYVSLPPGSIPDGLTASIVDARRGSSANASIVDGGFDPVVIAADAGDTLTLTVQAASTGSRSYMRTVPGDGTPIVVRTSPPPHKRDVPLNVRIIVVFSEPIDSATLMRGPIQLRNGGVSVAGQLGFTDGTHTVAEFTPGEPLSAATDYELDVSDAIRDLDGDGLASPVTVPFTTTEVPLTAGPFIVSHPQLHGSEPWITVSAPTGTIPLGAWVLITLPGTGQFARIPTVSGDLEPLALKARVGDTIMFTVHLDGSAVDQSYAAVVPARSIPRIVSSSPAAGDRGVGLGSRVMVVFSEAVDASAIESGTAAQLRQDGAAVAGQWFPNVNSEWSGSFNPYFVPAAPLDVGAKYALVLTNAIRGVLGGEPLPGPVSIAFTAEVRPPGPSNAALSISSFSMIEYQDPGDASQWLYSPRLELAEAEGRSQATVFEMLFAIPGLPAFPAVCSQGTQVAPATTTEMFGIQYGDYEWEFSASGLRASGLTDVSALIIYSDDVGHVDTLAAHVPVTQGSPPAVLNEGAYHHYFYDLVSGAVCSPPPSFSRSARRPAYGLPAIARLPGSLPLK